MASETKLAIPAGSYGQWGGERDTCVLQPPAEARKKSWTSGLLQHRIGPGGRFRHPIQDYAAGRPPARSNIGGTLISWRPLHVHLLHTCTVPHPWACLSSREMYFYAGRSALDGADSLPQARGKNPHTPRCAEERRAPPSATKHIHHMQHPQLTHKIKGKKNKGTTKSARGEPVFTWRFPPSSSRTGRSVAGA